MPAAGEAADIADVADESGGAGRSDAIPKLPNVTGGAVDPPLVSMSACPIFPQLNHRRLVDLSYDLSL
ncbi:hypothetical protein Val02_82800 [Virgisporangium aliadipatigenens]|uniref:Uncharacterized protein n=1 Tax=Virgisporangium aliadipatigenens TaxID=741659 RepID=A0A8J3YT56_9ACTN|nr:hypothetical protein Val02_82800 [Virgisporangium aliadipatigenens]